MTFPAPLWPLVAEDVLVETFEEGTIVRDFVHSSSPFNARIAQLGLQAFLQMMLQVRPLAPASSNAHPAPRATV